jgi:hypothetical protein
MEEIINTIHTENTYCRMYTLGEMKILKAEYSHNIRVINNVFKGINDLISVRLHCVDFHDVPSI